MACHLIRKVLKVNQPSKDKWTVLANADDFLRMERVSLRHVYVVLFAVLIGATSVVFTMDCSDDTTTEDYNLLQTLTVELDEESNGSLRRTVLYRDVLDQLFLALIAILYAVVMMGFRPARRLVEVRWSLGATESEKMLDNEEETAAALSIYRRSHACFSVSLLAFLALRIEGLITHSAVYEEPVLICAMQALMLVAIAETFFWMNIALFLAPEPKTAATLESIVAVPQATNGNCFSEF